MSARPLLIIGLDGATFDVLDPLFDAGQLPNLKHLCDRGIRAPLRSTMPPATLPAWTSFLCGTNPGEHGVVDMFCHLPNSYTLAPAHGGLRRQPTFLSHLSRQGFQVASLGVPGTFPPEPLNGICVAGFDAPGAHEAGPNAVWPPAFYPRLQDWGGWRYSVFNEHRGGAAHLQTAVDRLLGDIAAKEDVILSTYGSQAWDVFFVHLQASDTAGHHLWHTFDRNSPRAQAVGPELQASIPRIYGRLDQLIGRLVDLAPDDISVMVVSDHGMGGASDIAVHLNRFLADEGLLRFRQVPWQRARRLPAHAMHRVLGRLPTAAVGRAVRMLPPRAQGRIMRLLRRTAPVDFRQSLAFSDELDYAPSIWLNRQGHFPHGRLHSEQAQSLAQRLKHSLLGLRCPRTREPLIAAVHHRHEVCVGPAQDTAPDLLIEPAWPGGYRPSFLPSNPSTPAVRLMQPREFCAPKGAGMPGVHRQEGVFLLQGPNIPQARLTALDIPQAGALIYPLMGLQPPAEVEPNMPQEVSSMLGTHQAARVAASEKALAHAIDAVPNKLEYTPQERTAVLARMRALGYIE